MSDEPLKTEQLLAQAAAGDGAAWGSLLTAEQERLIRMVAFRMDPRLRGRIDAADVVQEARLATVWARCALEIIYLAKQFAK